MKSLSLWKKVLRFVAFSGILIAGSVRADSSASVRIDSPTVAKDFQELVTSVLAYLIPLALTVSTIAIIIVGFQYVFYAATGDTGKLPEVRKRLFYVLIGAVVLIGASAIAEAVRQFASGLPRGGP